MTTTSACCAGSHTLLTDALERFKTQPQGVSFTDCVVMAYADAFQTKDIFGFDKQFADAGYTRLSPSSKEWKDAA
jgi:predicted nucleic acid-binding protein